MLLDSVTIATSRMRPWQLAQQRTSMSKVRFRSSAQGRYPPLRLVLRRLVVGRAGRIATGRCDARAPGAGSGELPCVFDRVVARRRHRGGQSAKQAHGIHVDGDGAVGVRALERDANQPTLL